MTDGWIQGLATTRKDWIPQQHCNDNRRSIFLPSFLLSSAPSFLLFIVHIFLLLFPFVFFILMIVCLKQIHWVKQRYSRWMRFIWGTEERTRGNSTSSFNHSWKPCKWGKDSHRYLPHLSSPLLLLSSSLYSSSLLTLLSFSSFFLPSFSFAGTSAGEACNISQCNVNNIICCWQTIIFLFLFSFWERDDGRGEGE